MWLECPYLGAPVELTVEREQHVERAHPTLLPDCLDQLRETRADQDFVGMRLGRPEFAFVRKWPEELRGRSIVIVVLAGRDLESDTLRRWVVTAYISRRTITWRPIWTRS